MGRKRIHPKPRGLDPNIYFRERKDGTGAYHFYFRDPITKNLRSKMVADVPTTKGQRDKDVIAEANKNARAEKARIEAEEVYSPPKKVKVSEAWEDFIKHKRLKPSTKADYESAYLHYIKPRFANLQVSTIRFRPHIEAWEEWLDAKVGEGTRGDLREANKISKKRANNIKLVLKSFLTYCYKQGYHATNPGTEIKPDQFQRKPIGIPTYEKTVELLDALPREHRPLVETALYTGLRAGELTALDWSDVDLRKKQLSVHRSYTHGAMNDTTKGGKPRIVPLPDRLVKTLKALKSQTESDTIVFPSPKGNRLSMDNFRKKVWIPAVEAVGLDGLRFHDLRHTYITWLVEQNVNPAIIQSIAGHADFNTTQFYVSTREKAYDEVRKVFARPKGEKPADPNAPLTLQEMSEAVKEMKEKQDSEQAKPSPSAKGIRIKK